MYPVRTGEKKTRLSVMEIIWPVLRITISVYIGLCLFVFLWQSRYVYYPDRKIDYTPESIGLWFENVSIQTQDGETITGWFVPGNGSDGRTEKETKKIRTILVCNGNGGDIGDRVDSVKTFHDMGFNVLMFDYRGYGASTGKPTEQGTYLDVLSAWNYLKGDKKISPQDIIIFGQSLGGAVAIWLAEQVNPGILIIESTFTSAADMGAKMFPYLPIRLFCRFKYDSLLRIGKIHCPVLIAHSRDDDVVPFRHGQRLFKAANEPKRFVEMRGTHNSCGIDFDAVYRRIAVEFVNHYLGNFAVDKSGEKK
jgi:uncharacterized protein